MTCRARRVCDQMQCGPCRLQWDAGDPERPACRSATPGYGDYDEAEALRPIHVRVEMPDAHGRRQRYSPRLTFIQCTSSRDAIDPMLSERRYMTINPPARTAGAVLVRQAVEQIPGVMRRPAWLMLRLAGPLEAGPWPDTARGRGELWEWARALRVVDASYHSGASGM